MKDLRYHLYNSMTDNLIISSLWNEYSFNFFWYISFGNVTVFVIVFFGGGGGFGANLSVDKWSVT